MIKTKYKKWVGLIIVVFFWTFVFYKVDQRTDNSFLGWLLLSYFAVMLGYVIGRTHVLKEFFEKGEVNKLLDEYNKDDKNF